MKALTDKIYEALEGDERGKLCKEKYIEITKEDYENE
jgi:hypothetical protein